MQSKAMQCQARISKAMPDEAYQSFANKGKPYDDNDETLVVTWAPNNVVHVCLPWLVWTHPMTTYALIVGAKGMQHASQHVPAAAEHGWALAAECATAPGASSEDATHIASQHIRILLLCSTTILGTDYASIEFLSHFRINFVWGPRAGIIWKINWIVGKHINVLTNSGAFLSAISKNDTCAWTPNRVFMRLSNIDLHVYVYVYIDVHIYM